VTINNISLCLPGCVMAPTSGLLNIVTEVVTTTGGAFYFYG